MVTTMTFHDPKGEEWGMLYDIFRGKYLDGQCYELAIALHQGLGWKLIGLHAEGTIRHAVVKAPENDTFFDARGYVPLKKLGEPFSITPPFSIGEITLGDLKGVRPVKEHAVAFARKHAEALFPELPWINCFQSKVQAFADDLEALSRKHGLWVRGATPGSRPLIATSVGSEEGYELRQTDDGIAFTIDRMFA